jgi:2-oxoisovalerate dehydrogenase E1 component
MTFRMRGHEEASGTKYVPPHLFELWQQKDPIKNFENYLTEQAVINEQTITDIRNEFKEYIESELKTGYDSAEIIPDNDEELEDVYASRIQPPFLLNQAAGNSYPEKRFNGTGYCRVRWSL